MDWRQGPFRRSYAITIGMSHALIWKTSKNQWSVSVSHDGSVIAQKMFTNVEDAQAWCEPRLAEIAGSQ